VPADSASKIVEFTISIPRELCTNAKAKYSSSVVPPDPSVHFYHWPSSQLEHTVLISHLVRQNTTACLIIRPTIFADHAVLAQFCGTGEMIIGHESGPNSG